MILLDQKRVNGGFRVSACFDYDKTVINQRSFEMSAFENQAEENSVWILKRTTLLRIFCEISFTPTVTSYYQVYADAQLSTAMLCCFRCNWCRNLAAVNCTLHWKSSSPYPRCRPWASGGEGQGAGLPLDFEIFSKKGCSLSFEREKSNFTTFGPPWKNLEKMP